MMSYIEVNVYVSDYGQPECNMCLNRRIFVAAVGSDGNYSEEDVSRLESDGSAVVLVEGRAGNRVHLRPRNLVGHSMFGGSFAYSSDSRFDYERPMHIHDRVEG